MKNGYKQCPWCGEEINKYATKCRYCNEFTEEKDSKKNPNKRKIVIIILSMFFCLFVGFTIISNNNLQKNDRVYNAKGEKAKHITNDNSIEKETELIATISKNCITVVKGERYCGNVHNGTGQYHYLNGDTYIGGFKNSKRDGYGIMTYADGGLFKGFWKENKKHGKGVFGMFDGSVASGTRVNGILQGYAEVEYSRGTKYVGEFKNGEKEGYGIYYLVDAVYEGEMKKGLPNGKGKIIAEGCTIETYFSNFIPYGHYSFYCNDGIIEEGEITKEMADEFRLGKYL